MTLEEAVKLFEETYGVKLTDFGIGKILELSVRYGIDKLYEAVEICCDRYDDVTISFEKIAGVLYNKQKRHKSITQCFEQLEDKE